MSNKELWKQVNLDHLSLYEISSYGDLRRPVFKSDSRLICLDGGFRYLKPHLNHKGYYRYVLKSGAYFVHRLVLLTFKPNENYENLHVNHIDGNKLNNKLENLEWCTNLENSQHERLTGLTDNNGENNINCKYSDAEVHEARALKWQGYSNKYISEKLNMNINSVHTYVYYQVRWMRPTRVHKGSIAQLKQSGNIK